MQKLKEFIFIAARVLLTCKVHICGIAILLNEFIFGRVHFKRWQDRRKFNTNSRAIIMHHYVERVPATVHCPLTEWQSYYIHFIMQHIILQLSVPPPRFFGRVCIFNTADYFYYMLTGLGKMKTRLLDCFTFRDHVIPIPDRTDPLHTPQIHPSRVIIVERFNDSGVESNDLRF